MDASGNLYGTTHEGGRYYGSGTAFQLSPQPGGGWSDNLLHSFGKELNQYDFDGNYPDGSLISDAAGNLYGTTIEGGSNYNGGIVYELIHPSAGGDWGYKILHVFDSNDTCYGGREPMGSLVFDTAGNLYGATEQGGCPDGWGTVFELIPSAEGTWLAKNLYSFTGGADGWYPAGGLVRDTAGNLYGITVGGGAYGGGAIFELSPDGSGNWTEATLYSFGASPHDGGEPYNVGLVFDSAGNLYGTNPKEGDYGFGTAYKLIPDGSGGWTETILHEFTKHEGFPYCNLTLDAAGNVYGTTDGSQTEGGGIVFEITP